MILVVGWSWVHHARPMIVVLLRPTGPTAPWSCGNVVKPNKIPFNRTECEGSDRALIKCQQERSPGHQCLTTPTNTHDSHVLVLARRWFIPKTAAGKPGWDPEPFSSSPSLQPHWELCPVFSSFLQPRMGGEGTANATTRQLIGGEYAAGCTPLER